MTCALIYHDVAPASEQHLFGFPGDLAARYKLDPGRFEAHLDALAATGLRVGLLGDDPALALTFDDGGASALTVAARLDARNWSAHFFVVTGRLGTRGFLDADGVRELIARGHDVGSHSHTHPQYMGALSRTELAREWRQSLHTLGDVIGAAPTTAAVPGGFLSAAVVDEAARAGYRALATSQPTLRRDYRDGMAIHGRYTVWAATSTRRVVAYAQGRQWARISMRLSWEAKTAAKRISPEGYESMRRRLVESAGSSSDGEGEGPLA